MLTSEMTAFIYNGFLRTEYAEEKIQIILRKDINKDFMIEIENAALQTGRIYFKNIVRIEKTDQ